MSILLSALAAAVAAAANVEGFFFTRHTIDGEPKKKT